MLLVNQLPLLMGDDFVNTDYLFDPITTLEAYHADLVFSEFNPLD